MSPAPLYSGFTLLTRQLGGILPDSRMANSASANSPNILVPSSCSSLHGKPSKPLAVLLSVHLMAHCSFSTVIGWRKSADPCVRPPLPLASILGGSSGVTSSPAQGTCPFRTHCTSNGRQSLSSSSCCSGDGRRAWTVCVPSRVLFTLCQERRGASRPAI